MVMQVAHFVRELGQGLLCAFWYHSLIHIQIANPCIQGEEAEIQPEVCILSRVP